MNAVPQADRRVLLGIGLVQGLVYWFGSEFLHDSEPGTAQSLVLAALAFASAGGTCAQFAWTGRDGGRCARTALGIGALFAAITFWIESQVEPGERSGDQYRVFTWSIGAFLVLYIAGPFVQIRQRTGNWEFPYRDLFFHSWTNFFVGTMGGVYVAVLWLLLLLWAALFKMIGIGFFAEFFQERGFIAIASSLAFAYGISSGREGARFTDAGRTAALTVFRVLMPVLSFMALLFLVALPVTGLGVLWETRAASPLLLCLAAAIVLFTNAVFEDGERTVPYGSAVRSVVDASIAALPIFSAITLYSLGLRVNQYGLSPERFLALILALIASAYAVGYAAAVFWPRSGPWLGLVRRVNVCMAVASAAIALLVHTPVLDPLGWSARNQFARLVSGRVDAAKFDYASLRFQLGQIGRQKLAELGALPEHPQLETIQRRVRTANELSYYVQPEDVETAAANQKLSKQPLRWTGVELPDELRRILEVDLDGYDRLPCQKTGCEIFTVDLDADGKPEYCAALNARKAPCYQRRGEQWQKLGALKSLETERFDAFGAPGLQDARTELSRYRDVRIGDRVYRLVP